MYWNKNWEVITITPFATCYGIYVVGVGLGAKQCKILYKIMQ